MVVKFQGHNPFSTDVIAERDYVAAVDDGDQLIGWASIRKTTMTTKTSLFARAETFDAFRVRFAMSPEAPWDEAYISEQEAMAEMGKDVFAYLGREYRLTWVESDVARWILGFILVESE